MSYYHEPPRRMSRKQSFSTGLALGLGLAGAAALALSIVDPRPRAPVIQQLALLCHPAPVGLDSNPYHYARLDSPENHFSCVGGIRP